MVFAALASDNADFFRTHATAWTSALLAAPAFYIFARHFGRAGLGHWWRLFWTFGWLIGELVQRVSGQSLQKFIESEIAEPLQLDGLFIGAPAEAISRAAKLIVPDKGLRMEAGVFAEHAVQLEELGRE